MKRITSFLVAALLLATAFMIVPFPAYAAEAWDGVTLDYSWYTAEGGASAEAPYVISSAAGLAALAKLVNGTYDPTEIGENAAVAKSFAGKFVSLGADIDLGKKEWTPIGDSRSNPFKAVMFDGAGKTVSNLKITGTNSFGGLFGVLRCDTAQNVDVKNMTLRDISIRGRYRLGAVAGEILNETASNGRCLIDNIDVIGVDITGYWFIGGILGQSGGGGKNMISNSTVTGTSAMHSIECLVDNDGSVTGKVGYGGIAVGGIVGHYDYNYVDNCSVSNIDITGFHRVGGIAGYGYSDNSSVSKYTDLSVDNITIFVNKSEGELSADDNALYTNIASGGVLFGGLGVSSKTESYEFKNVEVFYQPYETDTYLPNVVQVLGTPENTVEPVSAAAEPALILTDSEGNTYESYATVDEAIAAAEDKKEAQEAVGETPNVSLRLANTSVTLTPEQEAAIEALAIELEPYQSSTEVVASSDPAYVIVIPSTVNFGKLNRSMTTQTKDFDVKIEDANLEVGATVEVAVASEFKMKLEVGTAELAYALGGIAAEPYITFGYEGEGVTPIAGYTATHEDTISCEPSQLTRAGSYSDTMVFACTYVAP